MKKLTLLCLLIASRLFAQTGEVDLNFAFSQLKGNGPAPFASALYPGDQDAAAQLVARLNLLSKHSGDFVGYEILNRQYLTKRVERIVLAVYFERFPIYLRFDYYDTAKGKICLPASVSKEANDILPRELMAITGR